ncbi:MAG: hypothetical protein Q7S58_00660 [Candidatus Binatus sp.]|uniref:hypothetical protein n=1 Tax=Candidatus Binatus sp. TaxID=2811406 RepID=UPI0027289F08|nr:hypothetical protein [Candidatus Binatus sp.]MDO8430897.1 hypothetical protein [Candidatus Binatus sp.]
MATPRKRKPSKRKTKPKRRRPSILLIVGMAALIAGFVARRSLLPSAMYRLTHREPDHQPMPIDPGEPMPHGELPVIQETHKSADRSKPAARAPAMTTKLDAPVKSHDTTTAGAPGGSTGEAVSAHNGASEHISSSDRQQLDSILKRKAN